MAAPTLLILPGLSDGDAIFASPNESGYTTRRITVSQLATLDVGELYVVLPGQMVRTYETELPKASRAQLRQMARFAREDDIASATEGLHIALSDSQPPRLAVVQAEVMDQMKAALATLRPRGAYADFDLMDGDAAVRVLDRAVEPGQAALDLDWVEVELIQLDDADLAARFAEGIERGTAVNLLQGPYKPASAIDIPRIPAIRFGAIAATALVCGLLWSGVQGRAKLAQAEDIRAQTAAEYQAATGVRAPNNPGRAAVRAAQAGPAATAGFLDLSAILFSALDGQDDIRVDQLRYVGADNSLRLRFVYPSFDAASRVEAAIANAGGRLEAGGVREQDGAFLGEATLTLETPS